MPVECVAIVGQGLSPRDAGPRTLPEGQALEDTENSRTKEFPMHKQRPIVYLALLAALGGLLVARVPVDQVLFIGLFVFMLTMHLGGHGGHGAHGGHGSGGHEGQGRNAHPVGHRHAGAQEDEVAGK